MSLDRVESENAKSPPLLAGSSNPLTMRGSLRPRVSKPVLQDDNSPRACQLTFDNSSRGR